MDRRLTQSPSPWPGGGRRRTFLVIVAAVALLHVGVTSELAARMVAAGAAEAMPTRIEIAYVRTLELEAPATAAPVPQSPAAALSTRMPRAARRVVPAASAPSAASGSADVEAAALAASSAASMGAAVSGVEPTSPIGADAAAMAASAASAPSSKVAANDTAPGGEGAGSPPSAAALAVGTAGFVWPRATRVSYILNGNYRGEVNGRAEVEWIRTGERYQVNVDLRAGPEFAPIFSRKMTSEGTISEGGLVPDRYDEDTQVMFRERRRMTVLFAADAITLGNGQQRERLSGVQDTASQFIQFTWLFGSHPEELRVGNRFEFPLALPRSMNRWTYDVAEEETLFTPFGELPAFHLKPRLAARKPGDLTVEMWFAPELRYLPVRIRIEQDPGTFIDLTISKKPEIADS